MVLGVILGGGQRNSWGGGGEGTMEVLSVKPKEVSATERWLLEPSGGRIEEGEVGGEGKKAPGNSHRLRKNLRRSGGCPKEKLSSEGRKGRIFRLNADSRVCVSMGGWGVHQAAGQADTGGKRAGGYSRR